MPEEPYRVNTAGFIAQALKGYVGHKAIVTEPVQNADDAGATQISFRFHPDRFEVRNNSYFSEQDWLNLADIASGGKH